MVDLFVHDVFWCGRHGQPIVALGLAGTTRFFAVGMAAEDAACLAPVPPAIASNRVRLFDLMESAVANSGGVITDIQLFVGDSAMLGASVRMSGPTGEHSLPAHFADAIAIACRLRLPLRMAEADVARIPPSTISASRPSATGQADLKPFRDLIESLDLDQFGSSSTS